MRTPPVSSFTKKGLFAILITAGLVLGPAASAQQAQQGEITGAGAGGGFEYASEGEINNEFCPDPLTGLFPGSTFQLEHEGTYDGVTRNSLGVPTPVASYVGPTSVTIQTGPYLINPEGTYTTCELPGPVPINSAIVKGEGDILVGGDVDCPNLDGTFQRRAFDVVEFRLTGQCQVEGNVPGFTGQVVDQTTTHVITGVMHPCYPPVPVEEPEVPPEGCQLDPEASSILVTDYVVIPESDPTS